MRRVSGTIATRKAARGRASLAVTAAVAGVLAAGNIAYADVMLSNFEGSLGSGVQGWFDYNGNVTNIGVTNAPTGGTGNWMHIGYTTGTYTNAGPTIQPWANSNFNNTNFQAHNYLHLDVIFPSTGPNAWLSNEVLPVYINSNGGGGDGIQLGTVDTSIKDTKQHLALDYSTYKTSNGGSLSITDWMNLLFGHADEAQWAGQPFNPYVYVDNIQLTTTPTLPPDPPAPGNGTWDATKSGAWSVLSNWVGGVGANGAGNTATFPQAAAPRTVNVDAVPIGIGTLTIDSTSAYTLTGNALSVDSNDTNVAGAVNVVAASGSHTISAPLTMARSTTFTVNGTSSLTIASLSGGGFGAVTQVGTGTLNVNRLNNVSLSAEGTLNVTGNLTGEGSWVYAVTTMSPATAVNFGANNIITNGLYGGGTVTIGAGGTLHTGNYSDYDFGGAITGAGDVVVGHPSETIGEPHTVTWSGNHSYTGSTLVTDDNTLVIAGSIVGTSSFTQQGNSQVRMTPGATKVLKTGALQIDARIDIADNKLITTNAIGTATGGVYNGVQGMVQSAHHGGAWDGNGLTTSMPDAVGGLTTIGVATGEQIRGLGPTDTDVFAGQTITGASTIAMYTYAGDANLDGQITGDDYSVIDFNIAVPGADGYYNGDFNYDGIISGDDYSVIDFNIVAQGAPFPTSASAEGVTAVPEPASIAGALLAAGAVLRCRRR